jgi:hypothetical protein
MSTNACTHLSFIFYPLQSSAIHAFIQLRNVSTVECIDLKLYCLLIKAKEKELWLALKSDDELYGWKDNIYQRSPLIGVSWPTNFIHQVYVGFDLISFALTVRIRSTSTSNYAQTHSLETYRICPNNDPSSSLDRSSSAKTTEGTCESCLTSSSSAPTIIRRLSSRRRPPRRWAMEVAG